MQLMTLLIAKRSSPARVLVRKVLPPKHASSVTNLHQMGVFDSKTHQHLGLISMSGKGCNEIAGKSLLAKLNAGDLIAQEARYHLPCLLSLYNRARETKTYEEFWCGQNESCLAFAKLVSYIEDTRMDSLVAPILKLSDLVDLYTTRLEHLELMLQDASTPLTSKREYWPLSRHGNSQATRCSPHFTRRCWTSTEESM
ncbi:hypothetical protein GWK47_026669 [Chionoecetes opilio]|uniref:Uncharacterized protein n=1 Tax=Chionoecetes opilio TaxID=41210 RepID=A0A8J8WC86_CHIOP|nr:hypothetical protein GWK47_026669 [Chionoecetes opilio]